MKESYKLGIYVLIFCLLLLGCALFCIRIRWLELARRLMQRSKTEMDEAARKRLLENRRRLLTLQREHSVWYRIEQELNYSGWKRRIPYMTPELWVAANVFVTAVLTVTLLAGFGWQKALLGVSLFWGTEYVFLYICKRRAFQSVNSNLIKFLDFLGNYSITAGELTGIFTQISKYVEEPLKSALDECSYEAQTTGDTGLALLVMAEKIEHPRFKELVRNMEISVRYCADFSVLVNSSRKSLREYLRFGEERRSMLREAVINMSLLLMMSCFTLIIVDGLIEVSVWKLLWETLPGHLALGIVGFILLLFVKNLLERR